MVTFIIIFISTSISMLIGYVFGKFSIHEDLTGIIKSYKDNEINRDQKIVKITLQELYRLLYKREPPK